MIHKYSVNMSVDYADVKTNEIISTYNITVGKSNDLKEINRMYYETVNSFVDKQVGYGGNDPAYKRIKSRATLFTAFVQGREVIEKIKNVEIIQNF